MSNWQQALYNRVPWSLKRRLVAAEARRRNQFRRFGDYEACKEEYSFSLYHQLTAQELREVQRQRLMALLGAARQQSPFYAGRVPPDVDAPGAMSRIPVLKKQDLREHWQDIRDPQYEEPHIWYGLTSGSTGTPLRFPVGREGIRARTAIQDNYYAMHGCAYGERRIRFGGAKIVPVHMTRPPFWVYSQPDNQLLMSAYHIDRHSLPAYVHEIESFQPLYLTGYAHALFQVAQFLGERGGLRTPPQAVFTDSEGLPPDCQAVLRRGFGAPAFDVYGLGEVGWVAVQCASGRYHVLELSCLLEVVDDDGEALPAGESGHLVVTDLTQSAFPYVRYDSGDIGALSPSPCDCGMQTRILRGIEGRSDDLIITPRGRKVGRLSHVTKPGRGIQESQIVQTHPDRVVIRVVPAPEFDPTSMHDVVRVAHDLLGEEMRVDWEVVDRIPRTSRHKFKHVVRECVV